MAGAAAGASAGEHDVDGGGTSIQSPAITLPATGNLNAFAGQTVRLVIEAADASTASMVEAGVDDVRISRSG